MSVNGIDAGIAEVEAEYTPKPSDIWFEALEATPKIPEMLEAICEFSNCDHDMFAPPVVLLLIIPTQYIPSVSVCVQPILYSLIPPNNDQLPAVPDIVTAVEAEVDASSERVDTFLV